MKKILISVLLLLVLACTLCACTFPDPNTIITVEGGYLTVNGVITEYEATTINDISIKDGYLYVNGKKTTYRIHSEPVISIKDGYIAVNGIKTQYKLKTDDEVTIEGGYLVVNGTKTNYRIDFEPTVSVIDGYVAVNGVKTEYEVNTEDEISVGEDGYLVVNGVKTPYELWVGECMHDWKTTVIDPTCTEAGYDVMTCALCGETIGVNMKEATGHHFLSYLSDINYHWRLCEHCGERKEEAAFHTLNEDGVCTVCACRPNSTPGVIYDISLDGTYAEVIDYIGTASEVVISDMYCGLPVRTIYSKAFFNNETITSVIIPDSVTSIGEGAFGSCSNLTTVYYTGNEAQWNEMDIGSDNLTSVTIHYNYTTKE